MTTGNDCFNPRFQPCYLLRESKIPCVVWFEDAVAHYGVPTIVFDFYILVPDTDLAAEVLVKAGWTLAKQKEPRIGTATVDTSHRCLNPPTPDRDCLPTKWDGIGTRPLPSKEPPGPTTTILLPAANWNFPLPRFSHSRTVSYLDFFPPLLGLLDALIGSLLDNPHPDSSLWLHIMLHIGYLYQYVPALKKRDFAEGLKYEHRQYHFDTLSGMSEGLPFVRHQRLIREKLRQGTIQLQECSADRNNEELFSGRREAEILALMPRPAEESAGESSSSDDQIDK
ncbi:uncharacterized protein BP5553_02319 [Venustampulla echinocandica]|uniref:Uncharacterized protein n=1 Tax=Venustampulla echinocandica TaxID=2656787 RepID=A0A370U3I8_9HELO|nr:uncharacterized protein BP5553_02319 [Venustampulla echinocandica]RDL42340.1 hypothetical protein BP5553_02319 [Venustampulla echinocandica]